MRLLTRLADICLHIGDIDAAQQAAEEALRTEPRSAEARMVTALVASVQERHELAIHYAESAVERAPKDAAAHLLLAVVIGRYPKSSRAMRARARRSGELAERYAEGNSFLRGFGPADTIYSRIRAERCEPGASTLRALRALVDSVDTRPAHRLLAEYAWRVLLRLVGCFWFWAALVVSTSFVAGPAVLRAVGSIVFGVLVVVGVGFLRGARTRLPDGYLGHQMCCREALLGFAALASAVLCGFAGQALITIDHGDTATTIGYVVILAAVTAAGFAHLLFFAAWLRRDDDTEDRTAHWQYALSGVVLVSLAAVTVGGLLVLGYDSALRPDAVWAFGVLVGIVFVTLCVEAISAFAADTDRVGRAVAVPVLLLPVAGCVEMICWAIDRFVFV
ncbi:tetratricopeptide repeat protein [Nocardia brevicatena]|uniref:tetratricopeptide repeat protein n=1 Tax=Nocardia brevicatena TaxID=37327 RepID=UPI00030F3532|nr:tetratricopeptide repeat protein [Nocardia brevicatena]